jgi:predicted RNA-binding protein with PIN domain
MTPATTDQMSPNRAPVWPSRHRHATGSGVTARAAECASDLAFVRHDQDSGLHRRHRDDGTRPLGESGCGVLLIVDGMNVIGTEPDGWWRDRPAARRRLVAALAGWDAGGFEVNVVFDGRPQVGEEAAATAAGVTASFAPGGRNAADDAIVEIVQSLQDPTVTVVVTSDRGLVDRVQRLGATVESAKSFRRRLFAPAAEADPAAGRDPVSTEAAATNLRCQ